MGVELGVELVIVLGVELNLLSFELDAEWNVELDIGLYLANCFNKNLASMHEGANYFEIIFTWKVARIWVIYKNKYYSYTELDIVFDIDITRFKQLNLLWSFFSKMFNNSSQVLSLIFLNDMYWLSKPDILSKEVISINVKL